MLAFVIVFALMGQEPPPPAAVAPATAPTAPAVAADDDARVVCVMEMQSGSHFKKKTCLTRAQWKKRRERDRAIADRALSIETTD